MSDIYEYNILLGLSYKIKLQPISMSFPLLLMFNLKN